MLTALLDRFTTWFEQRLGIPPEVLSHLLVTLLVALAYGVAVRVARRILVRTVEDTSSRYQIGKVTGYLFGFLAFAVLVKIWLHGFTGFATYLGLLSAGLAVALQDPIINLAGWLFIVGRRPFQVGERIQIGQLRGDVVDLRLFQFTVLEIGNWVDSDQSTGRVVHVPNGWVFKNTIANYDGGFRYIWNEIAVTVTYESDWRKAKAALLRIVTEHAEHLTADAKREIQAAAERYHLRFTKLTPAVWTKAVDSGIKLTMRYLCKPRSRRGSEDAIWEAVLDELGRMPDVDFAYPTQRFYDNITEGKPQARAADPRDLDRSASLPMPPAKSG